MKTIKERLVYLLEKQNITPYKLAKETGISGATLSRILSESNVPNNSTISCICNYFNVNEDWLRAGIGEIFKNNAHKSIIIDKKEDSIHTEAISGFKEILADVEVQISKLEKDEKSLNNLKTLQGFYKLRASLLEDISAFNN